MKQIFELLHVLPRGLKKTEAMRFATGSHELTGNLFTNILKVLRNGN